MSARCSPVVVLLLGACAAQPVPPPDLTPPAAVGLIHYMGSAISGPGASSSPQALGEASAVSVHFVALEDVPHEALAPLAGRIRLRIHLEDEQPVAAASVLFRGSQGGEVEDVEAALAEVRRGRWGRAKLFASREACLPAGATVELEACRDVAADDAVARSERLALRVHRSAAGDALDVGLSLEGSAEGELWAEQVVLNRFEDRVRLHLAVVVPSPFSGPARAVAVLLHVRPAPAPGEPGYAWHQEALVLCRGDLARAAAMAQAREEARGEAAAGSVPSAPALVTALLGLTDPKRRRGSLVTLANGSGAPLTADAALAAGDAFLEHLAVACAAAASRPGVPPRGPELGLALERATAGLLVERILTEEGHAKSYSLLIRHTGGLGLRTTALRSLLSRCTTASQWRDGLVSENVTLLEDGALPVRARAHAWLADRGLAPPGFDPGGPSGERLAALEANGRQREEGP